MVPISPWTNPGQTVEPPFLALERMLIAVERMFIAVELPQKKRTKVGIAFDFWQSRFAWSLQPVLVWEKTTIGVIT